MVNDEILYIRRRLKKKMDEDRFEHTIGVAYTSVCLAMRYGEDLHKAELAGLLHDCAKCIPDDIKLDKCKRNNIPITKAQEQSPSLLHAKLGAFIAADHYRIKDQAILNAIENHTTGRPAMSLLEKIVFVADYIEPRRNKASNLSKLRQMAFIDIDRTVYEIMDQTLRYLKAKKVPIDSLTKKSCDYYRALCGEKDVENETERNNERNLYNAVTVGSPFESGFEQKADCRAVGRMPCNGLQRIKARRIHLQAVQLYGLLGRTALQARNGVQPEYCGR